MVAKRFLRAGFRPVPLIAGGSSGLASESVFPAVFHVSVDPLAWLRVTVPRSCPPRVLAVRTPLHSVCVLLARPKSAGLVCTGLSSWYTLLVPGSCCGPACWARAHRATAHATLLLRQCSWQCCGSRPSSLLALISVYSAPPGSYHGSRRSGDLCRVALHLAVLHPCALPRSRSVKQRSVAESSWPYREVVSLGPHCPCIPLPL